MIPSDLQVRCEQWLSENLQNSFFYMLINHIQKYYTSDEGLDVHRIYSMCHDFLP